MNQAGLVGLLGVEVPPQVLVLGVISGLVYGLLGVGMAVLYKSTRVINFAHAELGALAATVMAVAAIRYDVPYIVALGLALGLAVALSMLIDRAVIRRLGNAPRLVVMVATIGVSQVLLAANAFLPRDDLAVARFPVPFDVSVEIGGIRLFTGQVLVLAAVPVLAAGVVVFWTRSRLGLGARAIAENIEAARSFGVPQPLISRAVWVLAGLISAASAILHAPTQTAVGSLAVGSSLLIRALAATVLGGVTNLPQVAIAGVGIGVLETTVSWNWATSGALDLVLLVLILLSMFVRREVGREARAAETSSWSLGGTVRSLPSHLASHPRVRTWRRALALGGGALAVLLPIPLDADHHVLLASVAIFVVMGLSVTVLTGYTGQVSLGQFAFVSLGAVLAGRFHQLGYLSWVGLLYTLCIGGAVAFVVGLPALRTRGLFLAVATMAFGVGAGSWVPRQRWLVTVVGSETSLQLPRQTWLGIDFRSERTYYWFCLAVAVVVGLVVRHLRSTGVGRSLQAVRDNDIALATLSVSPRRAKLTGFVLSGVIASLGGWLYAGLLVNYTTTPLFSPADSLTLVAMVVFGGVTTVTGAVLGAIWVRGIPYFLDANWGILSSGAGLLVVLLFLPAGLADLVFRWRDRLSRIAARDLDADGDDHAGRDPDDVGPTGRVALPARPPTDDRDPSPALEVVSVSMHFGGVAAVDDVSLTIRRGEVVGLLGPNGAGKTTLFDVLSGQITPTGGRVRLRGADVTDLAPEHRARAGLGRSFQEARLFPELSLRETFALACEIDGPTELLPSVLGLPASRSAERSKLTRAADALELLGLTDFADRNCGELSTGTRRFAELGLMVTMGSSVLLLDEPMAGIAQREVEAFAPVLREIRDHLDATIVLIDHDIPMMLGLCDRLAVMANGAVIAEGPPEAIRDDPAVVAAYLGTDARAIHRSGSGPRARKSGTADPSAVGR